MISTIKGNLLDWPNGINIIVHGCNTLNVMGAGIALAIANKYPEALAVDTQASNDGENKLGQFSIAKLPDHKRIVNLYIQSDVGTDSRKLDYEALCVGLTHLRDLISDAVAQGRSYTLGLPWIGCGLAGGDKRVVKAMIDSIFENVKFNVYIVELE